MSKIIEFTVEQIKPDSRGVLKTQGVPPDVSPSPQVKALYDSAEKIFLELAGPLCIMTDISVENFENIYSGNRLNSPDTPLEKIFPRSFHLELFAFTLGPEISHEVEKQFNSNELALGYMLDAIASYCTDKASHVAQDLLLKRLVSEGKCNDSKRVLLYSPGYCGWHISGQQKLFDFLKPGKINIELNRNFLMIPIKSISGVLVAGESDIHQFKNIYPFCSQCKTKSCRGRMIDK